MRDRKRIQILVIGIYLLYTVYEADWQLRRAGDFYQILGVPHDATEKAINSKFRRLTLQYHPDKQSTPNPAQESLYITIQSARDTLIDPAKRFAYDRFGPDILQWRHCKTLADFVFHGIQQTTVYYVVSFCVLVLLGILGYMQAGKFWRYLVMGGLFCAEITIMTRPEWPALLTQLVNPALVATGVRAPYLPFQLLSLLRKLTVTFFIALGQLSPLLQEPTEAKTGDGVTPPMLDRLDALASTADQEVTRLTGLELSPFISERSHMRDLKSGLREWLVQNTIRNEPDVKAAVAKTLSRRRQAGSMSSSEEAPPPVPPHLE